MTKYSTEFKENIGRLFQDGMGVRSICEQENVPEASVYKILEELKIPRHIKKFSDELENEILERLASGEKQKDIAASYNVARTTISAIEKRRGVYKGQTRGEEHHNWKGGEYISVTGYVHKRLQPDDEFFCMADSQRYVKKHRYVMAKSLGRPLTKEETVHHIDGNCENNDISNLQLRKGQHGKGQKYECGDCGSHNVVASHLD